MKPTYTEAATESSIAVPYLNLPLILDPEAATIWNIFGQHHHLHVPSRDQNDEEQGRIREVIPEAEERLCLHHSFRSTHEKSESRWS